MREGTYTDMQERKEELQPIVMHMKMLGYGVEYGHDIHQRAVIAYFVTLPGGRRVFGIEKAEEGYYVVLPPGREREYLTPYPDAGSVLQYAEERFDIHGTKP